MGKQSFPWIQNIVVLQESYPDSVSALLLLLRHSPLCQSVLSEETATFSLAALWVGNCFHSCPAPKFRCNSSFVNCLEILDLYLICIYLFGFKLLKAFAKPWHFVASRFENDTYTNILSHFLQGTHTNTGCPISQCKQIFCAFGMSEFSTVKSIPSDGDGSVIHRAKECG